MNFEPLPLGELTPGERREFQIPLYQNGLGAPVYCPFIALRGAKPGPVLGVTAAVHGNELNGINIIHQLLETVQAEQLAGTLVCAPVVNVPAFEAGQRRFPEDETDLNKVFPGKRDGTPSEQYAWAFSRVFLGGVDYLVDIHTASEGRINSMYVRADLSSPESRMLATLMVPQIILHGMSGDGTLRGNARRLGIPAITVEAGNPSVFQGRMGDEGEIGMLRILDHLGMLHGINPPPFQRETVVCSSSSWLRTTSGGIAETHYNLTDKVKAGQLLLTLKDPFGKEVDRYTAPHDGVVVGMSRLPVAVPGTRFCHLGVIGEPVGVRPKE